jgi:hypothetical protein
MAQKQTVLNPLQAVIPLSTQCGRQLSIEETSKVDIRGPLVAALLDQCVTRIRTLNPSTCGEVHPGHPQAVYCRTVEDAPSRRDRFRWIGVPDHRPIRMRHL